MFHSVANSCDGLVRPLGAPPQGPPTSEARSSSSASGTHSYCSSSSPLVAESRQPAATRGEAVVLGVDPVVVVVVFLVAVVVVDDRAVGAVGSVAAGLHARAIQPSSEPAAGAVGATEAHLPRRIRHVLGEEEFVTLYFVKKKSLNYYLASDDEFSVLNYICCFNYIR